MNGAVSAVFTNHDYSSSLVFNTNKGTKTTQKMKDKVCLSHNCSFTSIYIDISAAEFALSLKVEVNLLVEKRK